MALIDAKAQWNILSSVHYDKIAVNLNFCTLRNHLSKEKIKVIFQEHTHTKENFLLKDFAKGNFRTGSFFFFF